MKIAPLNDYLFVIRTDYYSPKLVAACRSTPGLKWNDAERAWVGYRDAVEEVYLKLTAQGMRLSMDTPGDSTVYHEIPQLRDYQAKGVNWIVNNASQGCLLADIMGAGKSAQAVIAASYLNGKTLIVCPSFVRGVWKKEIEKWWPNEITALAFFPEGTTPVEIPDVRIVVVHYDILYAQAEEILKWGPKILILDECHYVSSEKARRSQVVKAIAKNCSYRIGLSGTPLTNRPRDLWNVVDTLSPARFGSFFGYALRYADAHQVKVGEGPSEKLVYDFDGRSNLDELKRRMAHFMLRRTHEDIALELPAKTRQIVDIRVGPHYRIDVSGDMLLRGGVAIRKMLDAAYEGKSKEVLKLIQTHLDDEVKVAVGCYRREVAEAISYKLVDSGYDSAYIHGGMSIEDRTKVLERSPQALIMTIDSTAVGIDLTDYHVAVVAELTWEPHELIQWESRYHRYGQKNPVLIQYTIAQGSGEELIRDALVSKLDTFEGVIGKTGDSLKTDLDTIPKGKEALALLYERLLAK